MLGASEMEIRTIKAETITDTVERLFKDLNYNIGNDISEALCLSLIHI